MSPFLDQLAVDEAEGFFATRVARCKHCGSYISCYTTFDELGWLCSLCHTINEYSEGCNARYLGGAESRSLLPELRSNTVDVCLDDGVENGGIQANPLVWSVVDVTCDSESLSSVREALLTAIETLLPQNHFALSLLDDQHLYIMNWKSGKFHRVSRELGWQREYGRIEYSDIVQPVSVVHGPCRKILAQLESKPISTLHENLEECTIGNWLRCIFTILANGHADGPTNQLRRILGSRVQLFLGTNLMGCGRSRPEKIDKQNEECSETFYIDPLNADLVMKVPDETKSHSHDQANRGIFIGAGSTAVILGLAVDIFWIGAYSKVFESLSLVSRLSGGSFGVYDRGRPTLTEDVFKIVNRMEYFDCTIKLRTSAELVAIRNFQNGIEDDIYGGSSLKFPRVTRSDGFGVMLGHVGGFGISGRSPLYLQAAIAFSTLKKDKKTPHPRVHRYLRIITHEFPLARTFAEVVPQEDINVQLYLEFKSCMRLIDSHGQQEAELYLKESIKRKISAKNACLQDAEYLKLDETSKNQIQSSLFALIPCMENLIGIIRMETENARARFDLLRALDSSNCCCDEVAAAIYPTVSYWSADGNVLLCTLTWDSRDQFSSPVCLVDMYDILILLQASDDTTIRSNSSLMGYVGALRKSRIPTPEFCNENAGVSNLVRDRIFHMDK